MDKRILIVLLLIIIAIIVTLIIKKEDFSTENSLIDTTNSSTSTLADTNGKEEDKTVEASDEMKEKIKEEAYLNILLQIKRFDEFNVNYEPLLEAAMRIAEKQDLYQSSEDGFYFEYVPRTVIHDIIYELCGKMIQEPIKIEDFFYLYDDENDYYYVVPIGANWAELVDIESVTYTKSQDQYIIHCSAQEGTEDYGIVISYPDVEMKLKYKPSNKYVKYQLISIDCGKNSIKFDN